MSLTEFPSHPERVGGGDDDSIRSQTWDGRGPEPQRNKPLGGSRRPQRHTLAPWDDYVDEDEVEGGAGDGLYRTESRRFRDNNDDLLGPGRDSPSAGRQTEPEFDPLTNEQFYPAPQVAPIRPTATGGGKKKFGSGLFKHRSRYEQPFDTTDAVSSRTRGSDADAYQDEFEREINEEAVAHHRTGNRNGNGNGAAAGGRFDTFEAEGPEDAWAAPVPAASAAADSAVSDKYGNRNRNGYAAAQPIRPQRTGRAEDTDGDCESIIFLTSGSLYPSMGY